MKAALEKIWKLPSPQKRQSRIFPTRWLHYALRLDRDPDFICIQVFEWLVIAGLILVGAIILDERLATGILTDPDAFDQNKLLLPETFSRLISFPALALAFAGYLRARVPLDICRDDVPVLMHRALLIGYSRRRWIWRSLFGICIGLICIFTTHILVTQITLHYEKEDSLGFIILLQIFAVAGVAAGPLALVSYTLVLEKAIRCGSALQANLERVADYANNLFSFTNHNNKGEL